MPQIAVSYYNVFHVEQQGISHRASEERGYFSKTQDSEEWK